MAKESVPFRARSFKEGSLGQVSLQGDKLLVEFLYSPERVDAIKTIPHARFQKAAKAWTVPVREYEKLRASKFFNPEVMSYNFREEGLQEDAAERALKAEEARGRLHANPFSVADSDLEVLELDVVIRLHERTQSLRAAVRFRSKAQKLIEKLPGAHFLRTEKAYFLPVEELSGFLKKLRDESLSFGVSESAGSRLSQSAETRARLLAAGGGGTSAEYTDCLVLPYIDFTNEPDGAVRFFFAYATTQQLRDYFPDAVSHIERKAAAQSFDEDTLLRVLNRAKGLPSKLRLTRSVEQFLEKRRGEYAQRLENGAALFSQALLGVVQPEICWIAEKDDTAGLLISPAWFREYFEKIPGHPLLRKPKALHPHYRDRYYFSVLDNRLLEFYRKISEYFAAKGFAPIIEGETFAALRGELEKRRARLQEAARYQALQDLPLASNSFSEPELADKLFPHQRVAVNWLLESPRAFLGDDMGLGKTLSVLTYFEALRSRGEEEFLLVICPNSLTRNWLREAARWLPKLRLAMLPPEKQEKVLFFRKLGWGGIQFEGLVLNYEAVRLEYVYTELKHVLEKKKTLLCLDESQRVKNPGSKTFQAISQLAPACSRRVLLSGTPTPRDVSDIWAQMKLLDDGERFGNNFYDWLKKVAELGTKYSDFAVKRFRPEWVEETVSRTHEVLLRRKKEDVVNLPEKTFIVRDVELSGDQEKRYEEVRKDLLLRMRSRSGNLFVREISNILEEYLRAVQIASNPRLIDEEWKGEPAKFEELDLLLDEIIGERDEKVVVWTNYLGNVRELVARYERYGALPFSGEVSPAERDKTLQEFQQGDKAKVLVAVPAAGGVGITLTAAQTAIYLEKTWNAEHWLQSIDRIHRIGQKGTVRIISLSASKVDELIARNLNRKGREQAELLGDNRKQILKVMETDGGSEVPGVPSRDEFLAALSL